MKLIEKQLKDLPTGEHRDEKTRLIVRVTKSGIYYTTRLTIAGKRMRFEIGKYPDMSLRAAREKAQELHLMRPKTAILTFEELWKLFETRHLPKLSKGVQEHYKRVYKNDWENIWKNKPISDISKSEIIAFLERLITERNAPISANKTRGMLHRIFEFALSRDLIALNPVTGIEKPAKDKIGTRILSSEEIKSFWEVSDEMNLEYIAQRVALRVILLTGCRPGEILSMKWNMIGDDTRTALLPETKNGKAHKIYFSDLAHAELNALKPFTTSGMWVFPGRGGGHLSRIKRTVATICDKMNSEKWTPRDLRRTTQTGMAEIGIRPDIVDRVLNHNIPGVRRNYDHYDYFSDKKAAWISWNSHIETVINRK